jgi:hypothetical protein
MMNIININTNKDLIFIFLDLPIYRYYIDCKSQNIREN